MSDEKRAEGIDEQGIETDYDRGYSEGYTVGVRHGRELQLRDGRVRENALRDVLAAVYVLRRDGATRETCEAIDATGLGLDLAYTRLVHGSVAAVGKVYDLVRTLIDEVADEARPPEPALDVLRARNARELRRRRPMSDDALRDALSRLRDWASLDDAVDEVESLEAVVRRVRAYAVGLSGADPESPYVPVTSAILNLLEGRDPDARARKDTTDE